MDMKELLDVLVCPKCRAKLAPLPAEGEVEGLCCQSCQKVYPVREGIPVMLMEEALPVTQWEAGLRGKGDKR
ncbi:MAG: Trm112 family protein [Desulfovibrionaceae bacterium]|nr:Trm112 family protein [Desulfovibrionaceae bacterium]